MSNERHDAGYDVTTLLLTLNDINKHRENPEGLDQLKAEIPFLKNAHSLLGAMIFSIERDPIVDLRKYVEAAE